jgi:hypothetical protein
MKGKLMSLCLISPRQWEHLFPESRFSLESWPQFGNGATKHSWFPKLLYNNPAKKEASPEESSWQFDAEPTN